MPQDLTGKHAIVTGAGNGIGRAIAVAFAGAGARVTALDRSAGALEDLVKEYPDIKGVEVDLSTAAGAEQAYAAAGDADILSNNAGVADGGATVDELSDEGWDRVMSVNLNAAFYLTRRLLPAMLAQRSGLILNMASVAGLRGGRTGVAYTSSKWALIGMTENLAATLGHEGIRAIALCPGLIADASVTLRDVPATARSLQRRETIKEPVTPGSVDDVAQIALFLTSDAAAHLNGIAIPIDGGLLAR